MKGKYSKKTVQIKDKLIGHDQTPFFIAEIGINHNGDMSLCRKMIDVAVEKGCDAVKFQKRTIEIVYSPKELAKPRESVWGATNGDQKRGLEFNEKQYKEIDNYCKEKEIMWFASPWDVESVDFLEKYNVPCYKIASPTITDKNLLEKIKSTGKPIILSTGMSTMEQIDKAVKYLGEDDLVLLHCTSTYPSKDEELDLNVIKTLGDKFDCPVGYSGHEPGIWPSIVAVSLGACVVERHITLGRYLPGSDQAASLEPTELGNLCRTIKRIPTMLGNLEKKVQESEKEIIGKLRKKDTL